MASRTNWLAARFQWTGGSFHIAADTPVNFGGPGEDNISDRPHSSAINFGMEQTIVLRAVMATHACHTLPFHPPSWLITDMENMPAHPMLSDSME
jgi:hypothetical protein